MTQPDDDDAFTTRLRAGLVFWGFLLGGLLGAVSGVLLLADGSTMAAVGVLSASTALLLLASRARG